LGAVEVEPEASELLSRLERQAEESGRLKGRVQTLEEALRSERDAHRRMTEMLTRERTAAEAIHARVEQAEAASADQAEELERLRQAMVLAEQQVQMMSMQLADAERQLALKSRPVWRKLLRRPPAQ
jgi:hypothetical protein